MSDAWIKSHNFQKKTQKSESNDSRPYSRIWERVFLICNRKSFFFINGIPWANIQCLFRVSCCVLENLHTLSLLNANILVDLILSSLNLHSSGHTWWDLRLGKDRNCQAQYQVSWCSSTQQRSGKTFKDFLTMRSWLNTS